jgi:hypothetical protein
VDRVEVHWPGAGPPLAVLTDVDGLDLPWPQDLFRTRLPLDQRVWFCPAGNVLVTLPSTGQRLHLYPFNLEAALARNPGHAPLVTSTPPAHFVRGQGLVYAVEVRSARGGLTYRLEVGPPGMTVGPTGILTWDVPADFPEVVASVILAIRDGAGQEVFQTFKLTPAPTVAARPGWPNLPAPGLPGAGDPAEVAAAPAAEVPLPSPAEYVCAGAGGRYLLCQLPQQRLLAVFDVARAEIVKYLPLAADKALVAAGRSHLLVVYPQEHQVQRWSLATFEREATQPLPLGKVKVTGVTMGAASDGPLVVTGPEVFTAEHPFRLIDPRTLREQTVDVAPSRGAGRSRLEAVPQVGLSADGQVLCSRVAVGGWQTLTLGRTPRTGVLTNALENVLPGPDGKTLYTSHGPFTLQGVPLEGADLRAGPFTLPAVQGPFYLTVNAGVSRYPTAYPVGPRATHPPGVAIHAQGDARPLVRLYHLLGLDNLAMTGSPLTVDRRIFLLPAANLLVTVPHAADRLYLYRCDVTDLLEKAGRDFLLVVSQPPTTAARGGTFRYPIAARSRHGGIQYKLEAGPKGMTVGPDGVVTWAVPEDWAEAEVHVLLSLKAGSGMQTFHSFKITIAVTGPARRREP